MPHMLLCAELPFAPKLTIPSSTPRPVVNGSDMPAMVLNPLILGLAGEEGNSLELLPFSELQLQEHMPIPW